MKWGAGKLAPRTYRGTNGIRYCYAIERSWHLFTTEQKQILFYHIVQGYNFTTIGKLNGYTQQNASKIFHKACEIIQNNI